MRIWLAAILTVVPLIWGALPAFAAGRCLMLPPHAVEPAVSACETETEYQFDVAGEKFTYPKTEFQDRLAAALNIWLNGHGITEQPGTVVDFFLAVPELNPRATPARAVVSLPDGRRFVASIGLHPEQWQLVDAQVGVLEDGENYPADFGHAAGSLLVRATPEATSDDVAAFLALHGATHPEPFTVGWLKVDVPAFEEFAVLAAIIADPERDRFVLKVEPNAIVEWIATRGLAFAFDLPAAPAPSSPFER
jgi:hypothetical protein